MRAPRFVRALAVLAVLGTAARAADPEPPRDLGLTEKTERRLVQVELVVDGPLERVARLLPSDLEVTIKGQPISGFQLDAVCAGAESTVPGMETPAILPPNASVALYFDQSHLGTAGRVRALASAEQVAAALIGAGHRVRIVSNGVRLSRITPWTTDLAVVGSGLRALAQAPQDPMANAWEHFHLERLLDDAGTLDMHERQMETPSTNISPEEEMYCQALTGNGPMPLGTPPSSAAAVTVPGRGFAKRRGTRPIAFNETAATLAQMPRRCCLTRDFDRLMEDLQYQVGRAVDADEASFERLSNFLLEMEGVPGSRAVVLYADTLRRHAGAALLEAVRKDAAFDSLERRCPHRDLMARIGSGAYLGFQHDASLSIDEVVRQASARRVRLHTVLSQGLTTDDVADAETLLADLALETGGRTFRGAGTDPQRIGEAVTRDASCPVVLSLDPDTFPAGRLLSLKVRSKVDGIRIRAPGMVFSETPEQWRRSRWLAAALGADGEPDVPPVTVGMIPLGKEGGRFLALAQVVAPPVPPRTPRWDLEAYAFADAAATQQARASLTARPAGIPAVLETTLRMKAGISDFVGVARDVETDDVGAMRQQDTWPDLRNVRAGLSFLTMVQPTVGGFVREGKTRSSGALVVPPQAGPDPARPLAMIGVACRGRREKGGLVVERTLHGAKDYPFQPINLDVVPEECAQFRDTVPANSLTAGGYRYAARIVANGETVAEQTLTFAIAGTVPDGGE